MVETQGGRCASCRDQLIETHVDHDHVTGEVRGVLCPNCNKALGMLKDDPMRVSALLTYIGA
jgi:hypothetical protein